MYIRSFQIDGFGIFSDQLVENLSPSLSVFLGRNEAGKSTCLEFLRVMLTGYPDSRSRDARRVVAPLRGGRAGGSLVLCAENHSPLHLTRRPGSAGGTLTLTDDTGKSLASEHLSTLLHGISREVYRNVFGFSLSELQTFESLSADGVRNALYSAGFGPGLRAPGEALAALEKHMAALFKTGGSNPPLNGALKELLELREQLRSVEEECAGYDDLALNLSTQQNALSELRRSKSALAEELRLLERRLGVWRQWDEWRISTTRLERAQPVNEHFPEDGTARLARAQEAREACERQSAAHAEKRNGLRSRCNAITVDTALLESLPRLRRLAERKSGFRQAQSALPGRQEACKRLRVDLTRELERLGPGWDCARIRSTDRSLFAREDLERQAREMTAADAAHQAAVNALGKAAREVETANRDCESARSTLTLLTVPAAVLDDEARDVLRRDLARLDENRRQEPARRQAVQNARTTFARAFDQLRLSLAPGSEPHEVLAALPARQDEALALAERVREDKVVAEEAVACVRRAEEQLEEAKARVDLLREEQRGNSGPGREALDSRSAALRSLRALVNLLGTERERVRELDQRISAEQAPSPVKSLPLIAVGSLLMVAGLGILMAYWQWGLTSLAVTETLALPVSLWSGYLVLVCGVMALGGGLPRSGPEAKRHKREIDQLRSRLETSILHVGELDEQARILCTAAGVDSMDLVTLEATELLLEREREQCFHEERALQELTQLKQEQTLARTKVSELQARAHDAENVVQQSRRRWHEFMLALHVGNVPGAEGAAAFFARAEAARVASSSVSAAEADLQALEDDICSLENALRAVPAVSELHGDNADTQALTDAVRRVLESCREADAALEQRITGTAALQNRESELERAQARESEASEVLRLAAERLQAARNVWSRCLEGLGFNADLDPETVREAFNYMDACLACEAALSRAEEELEHCQRETAALREPLLELLNELNRSAAPDDDGQPDWTAALDLALADAEAAAAAREEHARLMGLLAEEEEDGRAAEAAQREAEQSERNLLTLAGAANAEDFLRLAALREEQRALIRRREDLEDSLRLAAGDMELSAFLASFENEDRESREKRAAHIRDELTAMQEEEQKLAADTAGLSAKVSALGHADTLADLRRQEAQLLESMRRMALDWSRHALAREVLLSAKRTFEKERQPEVIRHASRIFSAVTNRRWRGINASLEDAGLSILPEQGEPIAPEHLSRGTQEQAYLALRLAYIMDHARRATALPVIMDEILVNFDPQRAERTARALVDLTTGNDGPAHQILYFTCRPETAELLQKAAPGCTLFTVEDGSINRA